MKTLRLAVGLLAPVSLFAATAANAQASHSIRAEAKTQDFSDNYGSFRSAVLEYQFETEDTTVLATPTIGERQFPGSSATAVGFGVTVYQDWSDRISTRTNAFVAEEEPVFANLDFAQDVTIVVADSMTVTVGGRWARYFGGQEVTFLSAGGRRYFKGGSAAYRLTRIDAEGRDAFLAHLLNLTINDPSGEGRTQLWLSTGTASLEDFSQLEDDFDAEDRSALIRRVQPLNQDVSLIASAGLSSYERPAGRITSTTLGLGLQLGIK